MRRRRRGDDEARRRGGEEARSHTCESEHRPHRRVAVPPHPPKPRPLLHAADEPATQGPERWISGEATGYDQSRVRASVWGTGVVVGVRLEGGDRPWVQVGLQGGGEEVS